MTLGERLARAGLRTRAVTGGALYPGERWGFDDDPDADLVWLHGTRQLPEAMALHAHRDGLLLLVSPAAVRWCGPPDDPLPPAISPTALAPVILDYLSIDPAVLPSAVPLPAPVPPPSLTSRPSTHDPRSYRLPARSGDASTPGSTLQHADRCYTDDDRHCVIDALDDLLIRWSDHPTARWLRARSLPLGSEERLAEEGWLCAHAPDLHAALLLEESLQRGEPVEPSLWTRLPPGPLVPLYEARSAWESGRAFVATEGLDDLIRAAPLRADLRLLRATWALELGEDALAERLLAPLLPHHPTASPLFEEAVTRRQPERARRRALRARWRDRTSALLPP